MALQALGEQAMGLGGCWLVEVDIQKFFDTLDHAQLREFLQRRVRDGVLLRLIDKWLTAGVLEDGELTYPEAGTPQGGVISPLLANVYLHYVLEWSVTGYDLGEPARAIATPAMANSVPTPASLE